jgi:hypothetical protein
MLTTLRALFLFYYNSKSPEWPTLQSALSLRSGTRPIIITLHRSLSAFVPANPALKTSFLPVLLTHRLHDLPSPHSNALKICRKLKLTLVIA